MNKVKFTEAGKPVIAGVIRERTPKEAICAIRNAELKGANAIDLHLSTFDPEYKNEKSFREVVMATRLPILALNYSANYDYSGYEDTEEERVGLLLEAAKAGVSAVDIQGYTFDRKSKKEYHGDTSLPFGKDNPHEIVTDPAIIRRQLALFDTVRSYGCEVLLSIHPGVPMTREQVVALAKFLEQRHPDVIKIVTPSRDAKDAIEAMAAMEELTRTVTSCKVTYHVSGPAGRITRIVNPLLGGFMAFCVDGYAVNNAVEQIDLGTAAEIIEKMKRLL